MREGVEAVVFVYGLAVVGALALVWFAAGTLGRSRRAMAVTNGFQLASREAVLAIKAEPQEEERQMRALAAWEQQRALLASLAPGEQRIAAEILAERGCAVSEVGEIIRRFTEQRDQKHRLLDDGLVQVLQQAH